MTFPSYPEYKNSGVEWVGKVPVHWAVERLKVSVKTCRNGIWGNEANGDKDDIPCVRVADFNRIKLEVQQEVPTIRNVTQKEQFNRTLSKGDLLLEKSGGGENQPVGCVVLYDGDHKAVCSNFVAKIELAPNMNPSFWRYVHSAAYAIRLTIGSINQTSGIQNLDQDRYFNERVAYPPINEQTAIAKFLENETAKINTLITEQENLIDLLKEKRQAVISKIVSKGINPAVKMKESGVDWLGQIPVHWELSKGRKIFKIKKRIAGILGYKVLSITQKGIRIKDTESNSGQLSMDYSKYQLVEIGDFAMNHMDLLTGYVDLSEFMGVTSPDYRVFSISNLNIYDPSFYLLLLQNGYSNKIFYPYGQGSSQLGRWRLPTKEFNEFCYPFPPFEEQKEITSFVLKETKKIDLLISESIQVIQLLHERRSALISAAVTGQIDVRNYKFKEAA
jgi:type I restriction enzyme S subunit